MLDGHVLIQIHPMAMSLLVTQEIVTQETTSALVTTAISYIATCHAR